jgi:hypothetical protein
VRFQAVFYKSGSEPREFISRLTRLAEEGLAAKRFFFILLEKQKNISNKSHYIQYRRMMQEKNQSPRPLSGHTASELFFANRSGCLLQYATPIVINGNGNKFKNQVLTSKR